MIDNVTHRDASSDAEERELERLLADAFDAPPPPRSLFNRIDRAVEEEWGFFPRVASRSPWPARLSRSGRWIGAAGAIAAAVLIAVIVSVQTPSALADIQRGLSEEFRDACVGNCGTILSFRLGPGRGAQYLSDYVGKADRWFVQESQTEGRSRTWHALDLGPWFGLTARSDQRSRFTGVRQQKDQVLEARELTQTLTRVGEAYLLSPPGPLRLWTEWADAEAAPVRRPAVA